MLTSELDFHLPGELIAQEPAARRDESRLLVYDRTSGSVAHTVFRELPQFLPLPCRIFRNNATVFKARLRGQREGGGTVECLLLEPAATFGEFWCLLRPGKRLQPGKRFFLGRREKGEARSEDGEEGMWNEESIRCEVLDKNDEGGFRVGFYRGEDLVDPLDAAETFGEMPLPPYIERDQGKDSRLQNLDPARYQTVFADPTQRVAAAAPTAGLHFTPELLDELKAKGACFHDLTLHVGLGTFQPVSAENLEDHHIHEEFYSIPAATIEALRAKGPGPRVMIGTTSVRSTEDWVGKYLDHTPGQSWAARANLYIKPPYDYRMTDHLITNFHLPRSTLLCLVAAFIDPGGESGLDTLKALYAEAIERKYRFFSYGDAMLIL